MAGRYSDIAGVVRYIQSLGSSIEGAVTKALLATSVAAEGFAKRNITKTFTGRNGRTLGGSLLNNTYGGIEDGESRFPDIFLGVKTIPYGAIHEYGSKGLPGGVIRPVKAKHLWIPNNKVAKKMTPREFIELSRQQPHLYHLFPKAAMVNIGPAGKGMKPVWTPVFYLVDKVEMPERPYLRPALASAMQVFPNYATKYLGEVN